VLVLASMEADKLPAYSLNPRVDLPSQDEENDKKGARRGGNSTAKKEKKSRPMTQTPTAMAPQYTEFKELDSLQPPLSQTMAMAAGVTLREGDVEKSGPPPSDGMRMTRKEFASLASMSEVVTDAVAVDQVEDTPAPPIDESELSPPVDDVRGLSPSASGNQLEEVESPTRIDSAEDFNMKILKATNWGANPLPREYAPPALPGRTMDKTLSIGPRARAPRQRPNVFTGTSRHKPLPAVNASPEIRTGGKLPHIEASPVQGSVMVNNDAAVRAGLRSGYG